jgi:hypothetical protein
MGYAITMRDIGRDPDIQPLESLFGAHNPEGGVRLVKLNQLGLYLVGDAEWYHLEDLRRVHQLGGHTLGIITTALAAYGSRWGLRCKRPPIDSRSDEFMAMSDRLGIRRMEDSIRHERRLREQEASHAAAMANYDRQMERWEGEMRRRALQRSSGLRVSARAPVKPQVPKRRDPAIPRYSSRDVSRIIEAILIERARERGPLCYIPRPRPEKEQDQ